MPRGDGTFKGEAAKPAVSPLLLVQALEIPARENPSSRTSLYLTDHQENVIFDGQTYTSCGLTLDKVEVSKDNQIDQCRLRIDNVDRRFTALAHQAELNGVRVVVLRGFRDTLGSPDGAQTLFVGHILSVVIGESAFEAAITPDFSLKTRIPRRLYWGKDFPHLPSAKDPTQVFTG